MGKAVLQKEKDIHNNPIYCFAKPGSEATARTYYILSKDSMVSLNHATVNLMSQYTKHKAKHRLVQFQTNPNTGCLWDIRTGCF